jgi:hypothetical protein
MMSLYSTRNVLTSVFPSAIKTGQEKSILIFPNRFSLYTDPASIHSGKHFGWRRDKDALDRPDGFATIRTVDGVFP